MSKAREKAAIGYYHRRLRRGRRRMFVPHVSMANFQHGGFDATSGASIQDDDGAFITLADAVEFVSGTLVGDV